MNAFVPGDIHCICCQKKLQAGYRFVNVICMCPSSTWHVRYIRYIAFDHVDRGLDIKCVRCGAQVQLKIRLLR